MSYNVLLFYKFVEIDNPEAIVADQKYLCERLQLKGRLLVGAEGLNGTVAGSPEATEEYKNILSSDERFKDIIYKESPSEVLPFPKMKVKFRKEIISLNKAIKDSPGEYITSEQLHKLYESGDEFYIFDTRNNYESLEGTFKGAVIPDIDNFRDLPEVLKSYSELKDKKVVTFCTGGIRCEKASAYLKQKGFKEVYQLENGIIDYIIKYPNQNFEGDCYVFDDRMRLTQEELATKCKLTRAS